MPITPQITPIPRQIEILTFPDVQLFDMTRPFQVFATANDLAAAAGQALPYALEVVAALPGPVAS